MRKTCLPGRYESSHSIDLPDLQSEVVAPTSENSPSAPAKPTTLSCRDYKSRDHAWMDARDSENNDYRASRRGRLYRLAASTALSGVLPLGAFFASVGKSSQEIAVLMTMCGPILMVYGWAWLRVWKTGIYCGRDSLRVTGWWTSRQFDRRAIMRARAEPYRGWFYVFGWPVVSGSWQSGVLELELSDSVHSLGGTVTSLRSARRDAEQINRWLGLEVGAGDGPRRTNSGIAMPDC